MREESENADCFLFAFYLHAVVDKNNKNCKNYGGKKSHTTSNLIKLESPIDFRYMTLLLLSQDFQAY